MESNNNQPGFFARLKQHHLYTVVVVYAVVSGFLIQLLGRVFPTFGWSAAFPAVIIILAAGFPVAVVLAWTLLKPKDPAKYSSWQKLHWKFGATLSVLVLAAAVISGFFAWRLEQRRETHLTIAQTAIQAQAVAPAFNPPADSLVVLPFQNLSGDPKQQYFSDGITEELTDALGQNPAFRVIAWDTASRFRNSGHDPAEIGKQLNVANLLHGSIEREGDKVRITVELVDTRSGLQLWSQHYDDTFADIFKVQDQVSEAIADALKVKFAHTDLPTSGTANPEAHDLVLKGRAMLEKTDAAKLTEAREDFAQAIVLDPGYAEAHALLARMLIGLTERSDLPLKTALPTIRAEAEKAIALDPHNADAWVALALAEANSDPPDFVKARSDFRQGLLLDPSNAGAHLDYGNLLPLKEASAEFREATLLDPANEGAWNNIASVAPDLGAWAQEIEAAETLRKLAPGDVDSAFFLAFAYQRLQQYDKMIAAFDLVKPSTPVDQEQIDAGRLTYQAVRDTTLRPQALAALSALSHHQSNTDVAGNLLQMYLALGQTTAAQHLLERVCPADPVFYNDLAINPMYRALHGDPHFEAFARKYTTVTVN